VLFSFLFRFFSGSFQALSTSLTKPPSFHPISYHTRSSGLRDKTLPMTIVILLT
jgi:hypothetical protein